MVAPMRRSEGRRRRAAWLERARDIARAIAAETGSVTIDQVRLRCPPPDDADPRLMGAVFKSDAFEPCGFVRSTRRECHQRPVSLFRLRADAAAAGEGARP